MLFLLSNYGMCLLKMRGMQKIYSFDTYIAVYTWSMHTSVMPHVLQNSSVGETKLQRKKAGEQLLGGLLQKGMNLSLQDERLMEGLDGLWIGKLEISCRILSRWVVSW